VAAAAVAAVAVLVVLVLVVLVWLSRLQELSMGSTARTTCCGGWRRKCGSAPSLRTSCFCPWTASATTRSASESSQKGFRCVRACTRLLCVTTVRNCLVSASHRSAAPCQHATNGGRVRVHGYAVDRPASTTTDVRPAVRPGRAGAHLCCVRHHVRPAGVVAPAHRVPRAVLPSHHQHVWTSGDATGGWWRRGA
jgi:hypothetical protein